MSLSKDNAIFSLLILNDIAAGASAEDIDALLRGLLERQGYTVGTSKEHRHIAIKEGVALSAYDSPLVRPAMPAPMPHNVRPMRPPEVAGSEDSQ